MSGFVRRGFRLSARLGKRDSILDAVPLFGAVNPQWICLRTSRGRRWSRFGADVETPIGVLQKPAAYEELELQPCKKRGHVRSRAAARMKTGQLMQERAPYEDFSPIPSGAVSHRRRSKPWAFVRIRPNPRICPRFLHERPEFHSIGPSIPHMPPFFAESSQNQGLRRVLRRTKGNDACLIVRSSFGTVHTVCAIVSNQG